MALDFARFGRGQFVAAIPGREPASTPTHLGAKLTVSGPGNAGGKRLRPDKAPNKPRLRAQAARVLIVDDHPLVADAFAECIRTIDPEADITQATEFEEAVAARRERRDPDFLNS